MKQIFERVLCESTLILIVNLEVAIVQEICSGDKKKLNHFSCSN